MVSQLTVICNYSVQLQIDQDCVRYTLQKGLYGKSQSYSHRWLVRSPPWYGSYLGLCRAGAVYSVGSPFLSTS